jgi:hypothetical protein
VWHSDAQSLGTCRTSPPLRVAFISAAATLLRGLRVGHRAHFTLLGDLLFTDHHPGVVVGSSFRCVCVCVCGRGGACTDHRKCFLVVAVGDAGLNHRLPGVLGLPCVGNYSCWTAIASRGLESRPGRMGCVGGLLGGGGSRVHVPTYR